MCWMLVIDIQYVEEKNDTRKEFLSDKYLTMKDYNDTEKVSLDLEPLTFYTMTDRVKTHLREYIRKKGFKPGDLLPKDLEIAHL